MNKLVPIKWPGWLIVHCHHFLYVRRKLAINAGYPPFMVFLFSLFILSLSLYLLNDLTQDAAAAPSEVLWGISQKCDSNIDHRRNSIDGPRRGFDGNTASCLLSSEQGNKTWSYTEFERSRLASLQSLTLHIGFFVSEWDDPDILAIQISSGDGSWRTLQVFDRQNPPPDQNSQVSYDLTGLFTSPGELERFKLRFNNDTEKGQGSEYMLHLDEASLTLIGDTPVEPPSSPTPTVSETPRQRRTPGSPPEPSDTSPPPQLSPTPDLPSPTPTETPVATQDPTPTLTPELTTPTPTVQASGTVSATITVTATLSPVQSGTPAATGTALPPPPEIAGAQHLWGEEQDCTYTIDNPGNAVDLNFNDVIATCSGDFGPDQGEWRYTALQFTSYTHIDKTLLYVRFFISGWVDDPLTLEAFDGTQWIPIDQFGSGKSLPPSTLSTLYYDITATFNTPEIINQASFRLIGSGAEGQPDHITISMDELRLTVAGGVPAALELPPIPTPGLGLSRLMQADAANSAHLDGSVTTDSCAACHRGHIGQGLDTRFSQLEEFVCFACHAAAGPGKNVQPAFSRYLNTATGYYTHDVSRVNSIHLYGQDDVAGFSGANRHVECEDCHNPHSTVAGSATAPFAQPELGGITAVDPIWSAPGAPSSFSWLPSAEREYQVCFKCHSSFTTLPSYIPDGWSGTAIVADGLRKLTSNNASQVLDSRDMAREFNPYQASFHPVAAQGRNQNMDAASFMPGWSQTSMTYCSDCHNNPNAANEGTGPHGSPLLHLLIGEQNYSTRMTSGAPRVPSTQVCFTCHNYQTYVTGDNNATHFPYHKKHMDNNWGVTCYTCHDSHGSEQLHLINFDASAMTFLNGRNSQTAWYYDQVTGRSGCYLSCHSKSHNPLQYTP